MPKRFGPQHLTNGYAALGNNRKRPYYPSARNRSVKDAIVAEAARARRIAAANTKKK